MFRGFPRLGKVRIPVVLAALALASAGCATAVQEGPVGVGSLPRTVNVGEWPYWLDIPLNEEDYDRVWRTTLDVVAERHAVGVMDKESGYIRTEWKTGPGGTEESRYTFRIRVSESKIRMGVEVRSLPSQQYAAVLNNTPATPWTAVYNELRQRLSGL